MGCCSTCAQVRHTAPVVFLVDFDGGEHVYRVHPTNVQLVTDPVIILAKEEHGYGSGSESLDKHEPRDILQLSCWKKFHCCRKGRTIGSRISSLYFTVFSVPWTILIWVRPSWQIPAHAITLLPPKRSELYTHWSVKRSPRLRYTRWRPLLKRSENRNSLLKRMCCQVWCLQRRRARAQASLVALWRYLRIYRWTPSSESRLTSSSANNLTRNSDVC